MKHYIYIDKEILNSYISQIYGGILERGKAEKERTLFKGDAPGNTGNCRKRRVKRENRAQRAHAAGRIICCV